MGLIKWFLGKRTQNQSQWNWDESHPNVERRFGEILAGLSFTPDAARVVQIDDKGRPNAIGVEKDGEIVGLLKVDKRGNPAPLSPEEMVKLKIVRLFQAHGVRTVACRDRLMFADWDFHGSIETFQKGAAEIVQLDFRLHFPTEETLVESVAGHGSSPEDALDSALYRFREGTFHVLLGAFFDRLCKDQVEQEEWIIDGTPRWVTSGNVIVRGDFPKAASGNFDMQWYKEFDNRLKAQRLPPGTHWIRLYYGQHEGQPLACDVLVDNQPWTDLQREMSAIMPKVAEFYDVRRFLVVQDIEDRAAPQVAGRCCEHQC